MSCLFSFFFLFYINRNVGKRRFGTLSYFNSHDEQVQNSRVQLRRDISVEDNHSLLLLPYQYMEEIFKRKTTIYYS